MNITWSEGPNFGKVTGNAFFGTAEDSVDGVVSMSVSDTPLLNLLADVARHNGRNLVRVNIIWNFTLFVGVHTKDPAGDARYINRASANWQYDASGTIAGAAAGNFGTWTGTGAGVNGNAGFTEVTTGEKIDIPAPPVFNDASQKAMKFQ